MAEGRSRVARSRRKQQQAEELSVSFHRPDWQVWEPCELCLREYCVNNYQDRKPRRGKKRHFGVQVCPWCLSRNGHENARNLAIVRRLRESRRRAQADA